MAEKPARRLRNNSIWLNTYISPSLSLFFLLSLSLFFKNLYKQLGARPHACWVCYHSYNTIVHAIIWSLFPPIGLHG